MQNSDANRAAKTMIDELDLADYDEEYEFYQALANDEQFGAIAHLYQEAAVYATTEEATQADKDARDALKHSLREHAQRVAIEHDDRTIEEVAADE